MSTAPLLTIEKMNIIDVLLIANRTDGSYCSAACWLPWLQQHSDAADVPLDLYAHIALETITEDGTRICTYPLGCIRGNGQTVGEICDLLQSVDLGYCPQQLGSVQFFPMGFVEPLEQRRQ